MLKRLVLGLACFIILLSVAQIRAEVPATLILRSGDRISGQLIDHGGVGFTIRVNGEERRIATNDVAVIEFAGAQLNDDQRARLNSGQQFAVLRNGQTVEGRFFDIGGTSPLRVSLDTPSGQRDFQSSEVAQVYLANPGPVASPSSPGATGGERRGDSYVVRGNIQWTATDLDVRAGETLAFRTTGQIRLSHDSTESVPPAGVRGRSIGGGAPMPGGPVGALLGRIGDGQPFLIGNQTSVRMPADGRLHLGVNDDVVADNSGDYEVMIARGVDTLRRRR
jgi:hypothetical protein